MELPEGRDASDWTVVWGGLFAYEGFVGLPVPGQLFFLAALGLVLGAVLTVAVLWFGLRFAEVVIAGGTFGKGGAAAAGQASLSRHAR